MTVMKLQLKYCERCGSLRLRRADSGATYCQPCTELLDRFLFPLASAGQRRQGRLLHMESSSTFSSRTQPFLPSGRLQ
jgi:hypothetical protein